VAPVPFVTVVLAVLLPAALLSAAAASAASVAGMRVGGVTYAAAEDVARALGDIVAAGEGSLTWRSGTGTLTVFQGSPDALFQPAGAAEAQTIGLSAPALLRGGRWWLPLDALDTLGVRVDGTTLTLPDGRRLTLTLPQPASDGSDGRSRVDALGTGVPVLRLFPGPGGPAASGGTAAPSGTAQPSPSAAPSGTAGVAAMLADLDMLPLIDPAQRSVIDAALEGSAPDKPLLVVVTALRPGSWQPTFTLSQGGRSLELRYPYRMRLVDGSADRVGPQSPASVLLLLPDWFNLFRPITVRWQGVSGTITFRR